MKSTVSVILVLPIVILLLFPFSGCESDPAGTLDTSFNTPYLTAFEISPGEINSDTIPSFGGISHSDSVFIIWTVTADIEHRNADDLSLRVQFFEVTSSVPMSEQYYPLEITDGQPLLTVSAPFRIMISRATAGNFSLKAAVITGEGLYSNRLARPTRIFRGNSPPEILSVDAPDTLVVTGTVNFEITVRTVDPDGNDDVVRVHFIYTNPEGTVNPLPITLNKISPGLFRSGFSFNETNTKGSHKFEFQAFDRMNAASDVYLHTIEIK